MITQACLDKSGEECCLAEISHVNAGIVKKHYNASYYPKILYSFLHFILAHYISAFKPVKDKM